MAQVSNSMQHNGRIQPNSWRKREIPTTTTTTKTCCEPYKIFQWSEPISWMLSIARANWLLSLVHAKAIERASRDRMKRHARQWHTPHSTYKNQILRLTFRQWIEHGMESVFFIAITRLKTWRGFKIKTKNILFNPVECRFDVNAMPNVCVRSSNASHKGVVQHYQ